MFYNSKGSAGAGALLNLEDRANINQTHKYGKYTTDVLQTTKGSFKFFLADWLELHCSQTAVHIPTLALGGVQQI